MIEPVTLPSTGTYSLFVDPMMWETGTVTVTLHDVPADFSGSVTIGGNSLLVTTTQPGQNAAVTFAGTASQQVPVAISGNNMGLVTVTLRKPDGSTLTSLASSSASFNLGSQTLPFTGTYTIHIDPFQAATGSLSVSVTTQ